MNGALNRWSLRSQAFGRRGAIQSMTRIPKRRLRAWAAKLMFAGLVYKARGRIKKEKHHMRKAASA